MIAAKTLSHSFISTNFTTLAFKPLLNTKKYNLFTSRSLINFLNGEEMGGT